MSFILVCRFRSQIQLYSKGYDTIMKESETDKIRVGLEPKPTRKQNGINSISLVDIYVRNIGF